MHTLNATSFRKDLFGQLQNTAKWSEPLTVTTKDGNVVILSERDYRDIMATLEISSVPGLAEQIKSAALSPIEDCVSEEDVDW
ncbi:hypothetical protein AGMMS49975_22960 [Clostridia bacterium]|nr:hypothetical protein AGMMS49975_22960 [Clostridia bacterium]